MQVLGKRSVASFLTVLLDISWYFLAIVLALTLCLIAASPFIDLSHGELEVPVSFSVDARSLPVTAPSIDIAEARIEHARGSIIFPARMGRALISPAVTVVLMLVGILWVLSLLRSVLRTLRDGRPFVPANATRLRWIAWTVIAGELARSGVVFYTNRFVATHFTAAGLLFDARPDFNLFTVVCGFVILVIAEVFRAGTRLDEDQSLTV